MTRNGAAFTDGAATVERAVRFDKRLRATGATHSRTAYRGKIFADIWRGPLFSFVALVLVPARASASTAADCQLLIVALSEQTAATTFLREDKGVKTELQLQHHLAKTSTELDQLDLRTALRQMRDFESDVTNAVGSAVLTASDGAALNTSGDDVNACIQAIAP